MTLFHNFHIVTVSPWPLLTAFSVFSLMLNVVYWVWLDFNLTLVLSTLCLMSCMILWWRDVSREGSLEGCHTLKVSTGLRWGVILFIVSEVLLFFSLFWAFFHCSLSTNWEVGLTWPYVGLLTPQAFEIPLLNTLILLSSGVTVTWAHHSLVSGSVSGYLIGMLLTLVLGVYFTAVQGFEYLEAGVGFNDGGLGSCFYLATGVHGCHVLVGSIFLMVMTIRGHNLGHFSVNHHFGFEASAWYWHFVDVVWIGLFIMVYWWGG